MKAISGVLSRMGVYTRGAIYPSIPSTVLRSPAGSRTRFRALAISSNSGHPRTCAVLGPCPFLSRVAFFLISNELFNVLRHQFRVFSEARQRASPLRLVVHLHDPFILSRAMIHHPRHWAFAIGRAGLTGAMDSGFHHGVATTAYVAALVPLLSASSDRTAHNIRAVVFVLAL